MKRKDIKNKIKEYFLTNPSEQLRVRQIEREIKVPLPSAIRYTKELVDEKILKINRIANIKVYSVDRTSSSYVFHKKLFNLKSIFESNLILFLIQELSNPNIVLFGSYAKGEDLETSDIDLYIETPSKKKINVQKFEKLLQREIQLFTYKNIKEVKNKELANNIVNGVTLNGFVEVY